LRDNPLLLFICQLRMFDKKQIKCVIWGGYAWGNTGDDLCLAAALERVRQEFGDRVAILSHRPEYTAQLFPQTTVIPYVPRGPRKTRWLKHPLREAGSLLMAAGRRHFPRAKLFTPDLEWVRCLGRAERLYLAGGGYLSDIFQLDDLMPPVEFAFDLKIPVTTGALGIGPFSSRAWAGRVARALSRAELKVRDRESLDFCQGRGLKAVLEPDDAFALVKNLPPLTCSGPDGARPPKIGVCIFPQYGRPGNLDPSEWWIACLRGLRERLPQFAIEGFCFHTSPREEVHYMTNLFPRAGLPASQVQPPILDFRAAAQAVQKFDFIIAARFHAVVVANVFKVPNVAIASGEYYRTKMTAAAKGCEEFCQVADPQDFSPDAFIDLCQKMSKNCRQKVATNQ
jgi:polysaccharide pyruvyl transferase WcaK-like protein